MTWYVGRKHTQPPARQRLRAVLHILLVEDNGSDVLLIREAVRLSAVEADVTIAIDGEQALRLLNSPRFTPDLIVLDLSIPKVNGLEVLERYRRDKDGAPVVVFTSSANPQERMRALQLGAKEYLTKPMELDTYIKTIRAAIERWAEPQGAVNGL